MPISRQNTAAARVLKLLVDISKKASLAARFSVTPSQQLSWKVRLSPSPDTRVDCPMLPPSTFPTKAHSWLAGLQEALSGPF